MVELKPIGPAKWELSPKEGRVPVWLYANQQLAENMKRDRTLWQAANVSKLPGIIKACEVMPDGHEGYGFPIGGVAAFDMEEGVISPGGVGYDINCGVRLILTNLTAPEVKPKLNELMTKLFQNVPSGVGSKGRIRLTKDELKAPLREGAAWAVEQGLGWKEDLERIEENGRMEGANPEKCSEMALKRGAPQFGTLGAGNHFLEVQRVADIVDEKTSKAFGVHSKDQVVLMLHCGSRGFGHQVCDDYIRVMLDASKKYNIALPDRELCCAPINSPEAESYMGAMYAAVNYAFCNRQIMTHWIRETFADVFKRSADALDMHVVYDVCHNIAKFEEHEVDGGIKKVCVHRKGATRAFAAGRKEVPALYRAVGQPVIIPGSMGTASYLLAGTEGAMRETWGSTCHGAGRTMSRHQAIRDYPAAMVEKDLASKGIVLRATGKEIISEEASGAYKDVSAVVASVQEAGISRIVTRLEPMGVAKG